MAIARLGKLQTGQPQSDEFGIYGFRGGLNVKDVPQDLGDDDLSIAVNGYLTAAGGFRMRNGMTTFGVPFASGSVIHARFYQGVKNGAVVAPVATLLGQNAGNLYAITSLANTLIGSIGGVTAQPMTWVRFQDPNDPNFTSGLTDCIVICTGVGGPYIYDGTNLYTPAGWSAASGASWCAIVNGILWFGGIKTTPNQIFGSGDGIIASMETLPGYRNFIFSAPVTGLCASGVGSTAFLVVGLNNGVAVVSGTGPSNFYEQELPLNDGVAAGRAMAAWNGTVYLQGRNAIYAFSPNAQPQDISQKIEPWVLNDPFNPGPPLGFPMAFNRNLNWMCVYNNRLHVGYCSQTTTPDTIACYDLILGAWTVLQTTPGLSSMILLDAPSDPSPYGCIVGGSVGGQSYTWDITANFPIGVALDGTSPVIAVVQTKYFKIGVPGTNKALQRFYPEFFVTGAFNAAFTVSANYGLTAQNTLIDNPPPQSQSEWDVSQWDNSTWGALMAFIPFGPPQTRIDYPGYQGESFAFGVQMTSALSPWIFAGGSGVYSQRGRT